MAELLFAGTNSGWRYPRTMRLKWSIRIAMETTNQDGPLFLVSDGRRQKLGLSITYLPAFLGDVAELGLFGRSSG